MSEVTSNNDAATTGGGSRRCSSTEQRIIRTGWLPISLVEYLGSSKSYCGYCKQDGMNSQSRRSYGKYRPV